MTKPKIPEWARVQLSGVRDFTTATVGDDGGDGLYLELRVKRGDQGMALDLLTGALSVLDKQGAYDAIKELLSDEQQLADFVQLYLARKHLKPLGKGELENIVKGDK